MSSLLSFFSSRPDDSAWPVICMILTTLSQLLLLALLLVLAYKLIRLGAKLARGG